MILNRTKRIFSNLKKKVDIIVLKNSTSPHIDSSLFYVTSVPTGVFEGAVAFLYPDGRTELLTPNLEEETAKRCSGYELISYRSPAEAKKLLAQKLKRHRRIGLNFSALTHHDFNKLIKIVPRAKFVDVSNAIEKTRLVKDSEELKYIEMAAKITTKTARELPELVKGNMTELELVAEINYSLQRNGSEGIAFDTIVCFGPNSAEAHYTGGNVKLKRGDFILTDFGARYHRYCADFTRTYIFGKATETQREMYNIVFETQRRALAAIRTGVSARNVHLAAEKYIDSTKYKGRFIHALGHSIGLTTHDGPGLSKYSKFRLKRNMVFTVEPGIYIPKFGGVRIEDEIVVEKNGVRLLTTAPRELIEI